MIRIRAENLTVTVKKLKQNAQVWSQFFKSLAKKIYAFVEIGQQLLELKPEANMGVEFSQIKYATRTLEFSECSL